jgi:hypothetical protein
VVIQIRGVNIPSQAGVEVGDRGSSQRMDLVRKIRRSRNPDGKQAGKAS